MGGRHDMVEELERSRELLSKLVGSTTTVMADREDGLELLGEAMRCITGVIEKLRWEGSPAAGAPAPEKRRRKEGAGEKKGAAKKRRSSVESCNKVVISKTLADGYAWRKYGQKGIQNSKHPRSYFRCTHKMDRGCQATRQAQLSEDDPSTYIISYIGKHTCMVADSSVNSTTTDHHHHQPYLINFGSSSSSKQEPHEEEEHHHNSIQPTTDLISERTSTPDQLVMTPSSTEFGDVTSTLSHDPSSTLETSTMNNIYESFLNSLCNLEEESYGLFDFSRS